VLTPSEQAFDGAGGDVSRSLKTHPQDGETESRRRATSRRSRIGQPAFPISRERKHSSKVEVGVAMLGWAKI